MARNHAVVSLWNRIQTCWDVSMAGPTGLKYGEVGRVAKKHELEYDRRIFHMIQVMEMRFIELSGEKGGDDDGQRY